MGEETKGLKDIELMLALVIWGSSKTRDLTFSFGNSFLMSTLALLELAL